MNKNCFQNVTALALIAFLLIACDNPVNQDDNSGIYTIAGIFADGSPGVSTTTLTLIFDKDIPNLCADDIRINAVSFAASSPSNYVSNEDFPIIKGPLTKTDAFNTYELAIIPGNSGRIKVGLDPYRGFTGWKAVDLTVHALFHFKGTTGLTITGYSGDSGDVTIPAEIAGIPVTAIGLSSATTGQTAFYEKKLATVIIPDSVTTIGTFAFASNQLIDIVIPAHVTIIGSRAFANNQLKTVTILGSIGAIEDGTFLNNQITSVIIPDSVSTIGVSAFAKNQLNSVTIPGNVTTIGVSAFADNQLTSVTISNGVTAIGTNAFYNNQLESVSIPNSVKTLSGFNDNQLKSIVIPDGVDSIGIGAFTNNQLTSVTIPTSVTIIGQNAFQGNKLMSVVIYPGVRDINSSAFADNQLTSVTVPDSVNTIESRAFFGNQITSVTIGKDVLLGSASFGDGFESVYNNGRAAGTYTRPNTKSNIWERK
jgi:hypothetical protein